MSRHRTAETLGRDVLGPIVAEFCLRLWSFSALLKRPEDAVLLFCARGGLRMQLAYERFLAAAQLPSPVRIAPLMVSRVVAIRPALMRTVELGLDHLVPAAATTLAHEFPRSTIAEVAQTMSGAEPSGAAQGRWDAPMTADGFASLLLHPDGAPVVAALRSQAGLFAGHLDASLRGRHHAVLVDTGLYGTTARLLGEAFPALDVSSALIANYFPPARNARSARVFGLSVEADGYSPLSPRTALLRYWHFVEWLFEPGLPSVRWFEDGPDGIRSNLEADGWDRRVPPIAGTAYAGVIDYLDALPPGPAERVVTDVERAWRQFHRAIVWPRMAEADALAVGIRTHDFGRDQSWSARPWAGPVAALRGSTMWREGEIARSGSWLRRPLLAAIECVYGARKLRRMALGGRRPH